MRIHGASYDQPEMKPPNCFTLFGLNLIILSMVEGGGV